MKKTPLAHDTSGTANASTQVITTSAKESLRGRQSANDVDGDVRGLTTASAIWITAGLGMACGAGLFFTATLGAVLTVAILKISRVQQSLQSKVIHEAHGSSAAALQAVSTFSPCVPCAVLLAVRACLKVL